MEKGRESVWGIRGLTAGALIILLAGFTTAAAAEEDWPAEDSNSVSIYNDGEGDLFGRSRFRGVRSTVLDAVYSRRESYDVARVIGGVEEYQTAVVLSAGVRDRLVSLFEESSSVDYRGGYHLEWKNQGERKVFYLQHSGMGLDVAFSLDRPPEDMLQMVRELYDQDDFWRRWSRPVLDHYRSSYVLTIHRAENVFRPWEKEISYAEALLAATLLGDREQWLWGVHDGRGLLEEILKDLPAVQAAPDSQGP